jgi:hypothetical protein
MGWWWSSLYSTEQAKPRPNQNRRLAAAPACICISNGVHRSREPCRRGFGQEIVLLAAFLGGFIGLYERMTACYDPGFIRRNGYPGIQGSRPQKLKSLTFDRFFHISTDATKYHNCLPLRNGVPLT